MDQSDIDIIKGCRSDDRGSQQKLLEKHAAYLMAVIRRYCHDHVAAQDILQETWIQIFRTIDRYEERGFLKAWMAKIAISICYKKYRKNTKIDYSAKFPEVVDSMPNALDQLQYDDIMKLINTIDRPRRDVFVMKIVDGLNHKEISSILNIKESTSRAHLSNARKELRLLLNTRTLVL